VTNTGQNQNTFGDSRPFQVRPGQVNLLDPTQQNALGTNPSFPSGHTTYAYTDLLLLGMMVPELYQSMLPRASQYANSRIVLGVHYPLDIIGSRSLVSYDLAQALTNPAYIDNATTTGTAINLPSSFTSAAPELNSFLSAACGASVASCAANQTNPYAPSAANAATYANNLTYGLPTLTLKQAPQEAAPAGGPDAPILLATIYGGSSAHGKGARQRCERLHVWFGPSRQSGDEHRQPDRRQHRDQRARSVLRHVAQLLVAHQSQCRRWLFPGRDRRPCVDLDRCRQDERDDRRGRQARRDGHDRGQRHECWRSDRARRREQAGRRSGRADDHRRLDRVSAERTRHPARN
jgi:hypothetical protein